MSRVSDSVSNGSVAARIKERRGGELGPLDLQLLHSEPVADGWNQLLGAIRNRSTVRADIRELVILRIAAVSGATYEWRAHAPVARDAGVSEEQLAAIAEPMWAEQAFDEVAIAALRYTDAMTRDFAVDDAVFAAVRSRMDDRQLIELTATVAAYNMVSRFLIALEIS